MKKCILAVLSLIISSQALAATSGAIDEKLLEEKLLGDILLGAQSSVKSSYLKACNKVSCGTNHGLSQTFIEYTAPPQTKIRSPISGIVVETIRYEKTYGPGGGPYATITIKSDTATGKQPVFVLLSNVEDATVTVGDKVNSGCIIAQTSKRSNKNLRIQYSRHQQMSLAFPTNEKEAKKKGFENPVDVLTLPGDADSMGLACNPALVAN